MSTATAALTTGNASPPAGTPPAAPAAGSPATGTPAANGTWFDGFKNADIKTWASGKNFPDAESALTSYRNLESLMGADKAGRTITLPKDDTDTAGWGEVAKRLGVPESPDGYKLPFPEGQSADFAKTAASWFHKAGVPPRAANQIAEAWNGWMTEQMKALDTASDAKIAGELESLNKEWGANAQANNELTMRGLRTVFEKTGLKDTADIIKPLQAAWGADKTAKFFNEIGKLTAESSFVGSDKGNQGQGFATNLAQAQEQYDQMRADRLAGKINDVTWQREYVPKIKELEKIFAKGAA